MTQWNFPQLSIEGDRKYSDEDFAKFYELQYKNGVFITVADGLQVKASQTGGMRVVVSSGAANINGRSYVNSEDLAIQVEVASSSQDRIDSIVLRLDLDARNILLAYKQGSTTLERTDRVYELQLATIFVGRNVVNILGEAITDKRADDTVCGYASPFEKVQVSGLEQQYESKLQVLFENLQDEADTNQDIFEDWFQNLQDQLDENQAGNLQNQINDLRVRANSLEVKTSNDVYNIYNGKMSMQMPPYYLHNELLWFGEKEKYDPRFVVPKDSDFTQWLGPSIGYIGSDKFISLPPIIHGQTAMGVAELFNGTDVEGFISTNPRVFQLTRIFENSTAPVIEIPFVDTTNLKYTSYMFRNSNATIIDVSGIDFTGVSTKQDMFINSKVETLYVKDQANYDLIVALPDLPINTNVIIGSLGYGDQVDVFKNPLNNGSSISASGVTFDHLGTIVNLENFLKDIASRGSNADYVLEDGYNYRKWASGKLEVWGSVRVNHNLTDTWGSFYYREIASATFAVPFVEQPNMQYGYVRESGYAVSAVYLESATTATQTGLFAILRPTSPTNNCVGWISYRAIGRWM